MAKKFLAISLCAVLAGCSVVDPNRVGSGQYLQVFDTAGLMVETDTSNVGLQSCPTTAYELTRINPGFVGRVRCSSGPSAETLPYYFRAWNQSSPHADEKLYSSPFRTRARTSAICSELLEATRRREKVVVVEDACLGSPERPEPAAGSRPLVDSVGSMLTILRSQTAVAQIETSSPAECKRAMTENVAQLRRLANTDGYSYRCASKDLSSTMVYGATIEDLLFGGKFGVEAVTDLMCQSVLAELVSVRVSNVDRARYGVPNSCKKIH